MKGCLKCVTASAFVIGQLGHVYGFLAPIRAEGERNRAEQQTLSDLVFESTSFFEESTREIMSSKHVYPHIAPCLHSITEDDERESAVILRDAFYSSIHQRTRDKQREEQLHALSLSPLNDRSICLPKAKGEGDTNIHQQTDREREM